MAGCDSPAPAAGLCSASATAWGVAGLGEGGRGDAGTCRMAAGSCAGCMAGGSWPECAAGGPGVGTGPGGTCAALWLTVCGAGTATGVSAPTGGGPGGRGGMSGCVATPAGPIAAVW